ncbi:MULTISPECIES: methanogenesis marker protein 11 [Methanothrix]|uniref:methanogenesis marker protein 11 n=1 Tax=Methanothrix TaxID=2222 RepID=UPI0023525A28|nr:MULTISPECIES: methanogenesis marker protein 11 [Methanothrix]
MQLELEDPYVVVYKQIHAVVDDDAKRVELLERSSCYGGSAWARYHYSRGPLVISSCNQGEWFRYMLNPGNVDLDLVSSKRSAGIESVKVSGSEVEVTYAGLGGGGVGATLSRARAEDVLRYDATECGGGRVARGTIVLPRRERMIIGVDDTDSKTVGATWSLIHNIAQKVDRPEARYISHSLVQLFPVPTKTQNCVSTVVEFACLPGRGEGMLGDFRALLQKYTVSEQTGMAVFRDFDPSELLPFGMRCKKERVNYEDAIEVAREAGVQIIMKGQGLIGAIAALPFNARPDESIIPGTA